LVNRKDTAMLPPASRSAVSNGRRAFVLGDGRGPWARRQRDLMADLASDAGGIEVLSTAQASLCRRCSTIMVELEFMEGQLSLGEKVDLDIYGRLSGHLHRMLVTLGIERRAKTIPSPLADYFARPLSKDD
jgi:hypothetical protein